MAHFAAPAGLLVAAEGQRRVENVVAVDPHGSGAQLVGHAVGFADVARPDAGGQAIHVVVGAGTISSGSVNGIAATTGPKISSCTTFMFSFVLTSTVGSTKYPLSPDACAASHCLRAFEQPGFEISANPVQLFVRKPADPFRLRSRVPVRL